MMNASSLSNYLELDRFKSYPCQVHDSILAIGSDKHLILSNLPFNNNNNNDSNRPEPSITHDVPRIFEFPDLGENSSRISVLSWIASDFLCVGFENGYLYGYLIKENIQEVFQLSAGNSSVQAIKTFEERGLTRVWILYEEGLLVVVSNNTFSFTFFFTISFRPPLSPFFPHLLPGASLILHISLPLPSPPPFFSTSLFISREI